MAKNLAPSSRKWHKKNQIGENGGERKINPSAKPAGKYLLKTPATCGIELHVTKYMIDISITNLSVCLSIGAATRYIIGLYNLYGRVLSEVRARLGFR